MSTSEFDERLRQKMDEGDFEFVPAQWLQMAQDLDATEDRKAPVLRKRYWLALIGTIASTAAVWASIALFVKPDPDSHKTAATSTAAIQQQTSIAMQVPALKTQSARLAPAAVAKITRTLQTIKTQDQGNNVPEVAAAAIPAQAVSADTSMVTASVNAPISRPLPSFTARDMEHQTDKAEDAWSDHNFVYEPRESKQAKTSLGVAGGLNYGTSRAGYTLGVNARRRIGGKFYVEGDLALVNNTAQNANTLATSEYNRISTDITSSPGTPPSNVFIASAVKNASTKEALSSLYYLQVAPSLGYHVSRKLSLSAGADIQKMLQHNSDETAISLVDNAVKVIPETDIGLTGKIEYGITPKLLTGMSYREGINAMMDSKYLNRSYLQVQVKFLIFNK